MNWNSYTKYVIPRTQTLEQGAMFLGDVSNAERA